MHQLYQEHRAIEEAAGRLRSALTSALTGCSGSLAAIGGLRQDLALLLQKHLSSENELLIARLDRGQRERISAFDAVLAATRDLRLAYSAHVTQWHYRRVKEDLGGYAADVDVLLAGMRDQIAFEETSLYSPGLRLLAEPLPRGHVTMERSTHARRACMPGQQHEPSAPVSSVAFARPSSRPLIAGTSGSGHAIATNV